MTVSRLPFKWATCHLMNGDRRRCHWPGLLYSLQAEKLTCLP